MTRNLSRSWYIVFFRGGCGEQGRYNLEKRNRQDWCPWQHKGWQKREKTETFRKTEERKKEHLGEKSKGEQGTRSNLHDMKVINLSNVKLKEKHIELLQKGLSFSLMSRINEFEIFKSISLLLRKVLSWANPF